MPRLPTLLFLVVLLAVVVAAAFEHFEPEVWQSRLAVFLGKAEVSRHTPLYAEGTMLPPRLTTNTTLTPDQNPVILPARTRVEPGTTLTIEPGVHLFAHEFAELSISGTLRMQGDEKNPIVFTTNERHPLNQLWNGIIVEAGGQATILHTQIDYASPGLTCLADSIAQISNSEIKNTLTGIFTNSPTCTFSDNRIQAIREDYVRTF